MLRVQGIEVTGIHVMNSPYYHIQMIDCKDGWFHDMRISVSMWGTLEFKLLLQEDSNLMFWTNFASLDLTINELPSVPTNTDGIDVNGENFVIERIRIENNWDDAIVMKSADQTQQLSTCT